ncbi:4Fe-4S binding protein [Catellatospora coxensis]
MPRARRGRRGVRGGRARAGPRRLAPLRAPGPGSVHRVRAMCAHVRRRAGHVRSDAGRRGADTVVAPGPGSWAQSACVSCGGCVDTCPTGAITQAGRQVAPFRRSRWTPRAGTAVSGAR